MATNDDLIQFTHDALGRGLSRATVTDVLSQAGWHPSQIRAALAAFADVSAPLPVPAPRAYVSARDAFRYLLLFVTLYIVAYHVGSLAFYFIERAFPDPAGPELARQVANAASQFRWAVASLLVATPVFVGMSVVTGRDIQRHPAQRLSAVRRWLTYATLLVAAGVVIGDVTTLIYNVLSGELAPRFLLKVVTVGVIAGGVLAYYRRAIDADSD